MSTLCRAALAALALLLSLSASIAHAETTLVVVSPSGGETWEVGARRQITWSGPLGGNVKIELSRDGGLTFEALFSNTPNDGVQEWEVDDPLTVSARVRITWLEDRAVSAVSTGTFAVVDSVVGLTVREPQLGDTWLIGSVRHIKWNAAAGGDVRIARSCDGGVTFDTIVDETSNDGDEPWTVTGPAGTCHLRIVHLDDATLAGDSADFTIGEPATFHLTAPNGGETWALGTGHLILWDSPRSGHVKIELSRDGGVSYQILFASTPDDGAVEWEVDGPASATCRVRLSSVEDASLVSVSAANFAVVSEVVGLTVVEPQADSVWVVGTGQLIRWDSPPQGTVKIELSRDGGTTFETLFAATPNDGQELWTVAAPIGRGRLRITRVEDPTITADSGEFSITRAEGVLVTAPNGGEVWAVGSKQAITWQGIEGGRVSIELTRDGGATWETLFTNRVDHESGSVTWVVDGAPSNDCRIRVTRTTAPLVSDVTDEPFAITISPLTLTGPPEGDELVVGTQRLITWSGLGFGQVEIDLSRNGGLTWETIIARTPNDGAQYWTVSGQPTNEALLRIVGLDALPGADVSDGPFVIRQGTITLVQPNGGERWRIGQPQLITWQTTTGGSLRVDLSRDGGLWEPLLVNTPNDGHELWSVSGPPCEACWLRLVSLATDGLQAQTAGPFTIFCAPTATTIAAGETKSGTLEAGQCEAPHRPGARGQLYTFSMPASGVAAFDLTSSEFSPYLLLTGPNGQVIAETGGPTGRARLESELAEGGPYTVEVTSADDGGAGAYQLSFVRFDIALLGPAAGEVWKLGELRSITWRSGAPASPVDIMLFRDGNPNGTGEHLFMTTPNDGQQVWKVTGPPSAGAVIKVCVGTGGTRACATSPLFALQTCAPFEIRSCYSGSPRTQGIGACHAGHLQCLNGAFQGCVDEVLPTAEECGDAIDQDCDGTDALCQPCSELGSCADDDPCTADSCAQGECRHDRLTGWPLFECRRDVLRLSLGSVDASCQGSGKPSVGRRQRRKLSRLLSVVENAVARARGALIKARCSRQVERARRLMDRLQAELGQASARGSVCDQSPLLNRRVADLSAALVAAGNCAL